MKILVFCPTYKTTDGSLAIYPDTRASIDALEHGGHQVATIIRPSPKEDKTGNVLGQYQWARAETLAGGYDAVLFIEHDMIVQPDTLVKLAGTPDADVVYGIYMFRHGKPTLNAFRAVNGPTHDQTLQLFPGELKKAVSAVVWPVSGLGFGCLFIHRHVLEVIEMHASPEGFYPDGPFANDCIKHGFKQMARFDVVCGHIRPDGYVLWPILDGRDMAMDLVKVKILRTFNAGIGGVSIPFEAGQTAQVPLNEAYELERGGYLSVLESVPQVKILNKPERKLRVAVK